MKKENEKRLKQNVNSYLRYSGLGLQLLVTILAAGWVGYKIDQHLAIRFPVFMLTLGFAAFGGSIYQLYRKVKKE